MKRFLVSFIALFVFCVTLPLSVDAQKCKRKSYRNGNYGVAGYRAYNRDYRRGDVRGYSYQRRPSVYRRHRNLINIGIGTGAGALLGGLIGGKRGAGWGALAGAGAGALYTYKINPKRRYYRR